MKVKYYNTIVAHIKTLHEKFFNESVHSRIHLAYNLGMIRESVAFHRINAYIDDETAKACETEIDKEFNLLMGI